MRVLFFFFIFLVLSCQTNKSHDLKESSTSEQNVTVEKNNNKLKYQQAMKNDQVEIIESLINEGTDLNKFNIQGIKPLIYALKNNSPKIAKLLIEIGSDIDTIDKNGWSPLMYAIKYEQPENAKLLIDKGVTLNFVNNKGGSPMMFAIKSDQIDIVRVLIENGAELNILSYDGLIPLLNAIYNDKTEIAMLIIQNGADINIQDSSGWTPLMFAILKDNSKLVSYLLSVGAETRVETFSGNFSPIILTAHNKTYDLLDTLIEEKDQLSNNEMKAIAWAYATDNINKQDLQQALYYALKINENTNYENDLYLDTLAVVYASLENWELAIKYQELAIELIKDNDDYNDFQRRLEMYKNEINYLK